MSTVIRVSGLGKEYIIGGREKGHETFREMLTSSLTAPFRRLRKLKGAVAEEERFWALKEVSFEVRQGEVVGIIGRNGAGKSTLLKILSRITEPTEGRIEIRGRVASLLEVGTGFHTELTGRENIYLNGAILGMSRAEIARKFDEIVAFAEVEKFLDTPVKRYSSGMYVRLAFAVAAHLEPEILIVDEVLAVGDAAFQKKCLGKMQDVAEQGRTVLFVSHNMAAIRTLCDRGLLLEQGIIVCDAPIGLVIESYMENLQSSALSHLFSDKNIVAIDEIVLMKAWTEDHTGLQADSFFCDEDFIIVLEYKIYKNISGMRTGITVEKSDGVTMFGSTDWGGWKTKDRQLGIYQSRCRVPAYLLNYGTYSIFFSVDIPPYTTPLLKAINCLTFIISDREKHGPINHHLPGVTRPKLDWSVICRKASDEDSEFDGFNLDQGIK